MAAMAMALRVVVPPHPLLSHWLTVLREPQTPPPLYGSALAELGRWLCYEALRDWLPQRQLSLETPRGVVQAQVVDASVPLLALVDLPAGVGLWQGAQSVLPAAQLGHVATGASGIAWHNWPDPISDTTGVMLFYAELAEPEPLLLLLDALRDRGVCGPRLRLITSVAAAPSLQILGERHGDLTVYTAAIDPELTADGQVGPGIGALQPRLLGFDQAP